LLINLLGMDTGVRVVDNLSSDRIENIKHLESSTELEILGMVSRLGATYT